MVAPLTGLGAEWGRFQQDGAKLAVFMPEGSWGFAAGLFRRVRGASKEAATLVPPLPLTTQTAQSDGTVLLSVRRISKHFGGLKAVDEVDLEVQRNRVHALIGPQRPGQAHVAERALGSVRFQRRRDHARRRGNRRAAAARACRAQAWHPPMRTARQDPLVRCVAVRSSLVASDSGR